MLTVIIAIHNILPNRGIERLGNLLYSISRNTVKPTKVLLMDSSKPQYLERTVRYLKRLKYDVNWGHILVNLSDFNKPKLYNIGLELCNTDWVMFTDCDYLFSRDFFEVCEKERSAGTFLMKKVDSLPKSFNAKQHHIKYWQFPETEPFPFGDHACGACQYAPTEWFRENLYCEELKGLGCMDVYQKLLAKESGLKLHWMEGGQILHQWHQPSNKKNTEQFMRNVRLTEKRFRK